VAINKMDLVEYSEARFNEIRDEFEAMAGLLDTPPGHLTFVPISALSGDNVVERSTAMSWYEGPTLLQHLETVDVAALADQAANVGVRVPVQYVIRPHRADYPDYRGYAGTVAAAELRVGAEVAVLPSGVTTRVAGIDTADGPVEVAQPGQAVTVLLADDVDVSRGDTIAAADDQPITQRDVVATLAWMDASAELALRRPYTLKQATRTVRAMVTDLHYRLDVERLGEPQKADTLAANDIGLASLRLTEPVVVDDYRRNRVTGSFVLIDEVTNQTVAAGLVRLD
jgi:bifunctional enzyme CysN/CysC